MGFAGGRHIEKGSIIVDLRCRNGQSTRVQEKLYMTLHPFILRTIVEEGV